jgi:hypothetical protein
VAASVEQALKWLPKKKGQPHVSPALASPIANPMKDYLSMRQLDLR